LPLLLHVAGQQEERPVGGGVPPFKPLGRFDGTAQDGTIISPWLGCVQMCKWSE